MAEIDRRVRLLTDTLMERGFSWLAAEIIGAIEAGREDPDGRDYAVAEQRKDLNARPRNAHISDIVSPQRLAVATSRSEQVNQPFAPDEQVEFAVQYMADRLMLATEMMQKGLHVFSELMGNPVTFAVEFDGKRRDTDIAEAVRAVREVHDMQQELALWLRTQTAEGTE